MLTVKIEKTVGHICSHSSTSIVYSCFFSDLVPGKSMQEILLGATHEAQSIIVECLNGYNYGQTFAALSTHLQEMAGKTETLRRIKTDVMQVCDQGHPFITFLFGTNLFQWFHPTPKLVAERGVMYWMVR